MPGLDIDDDTFGHSLQREIITNVLRLVSNKKIYIYRIGYIGLDIPDTILIHLRCGGGGGGGGGGGVEGCDTTLEMNGRSIIIMLIYVDFNPPSPLPPPSLPHPTPPHQSFNS